MIPVYAVPGTALPACSRNQVPSLDYYGESRPAHDTPWDFLELLPMDRRNLVCSIGKVAGRGVAASFAMASLLAFLRTLALRHRGSAGALANDLNRAVYDISPDGFYASMFYAWFDPARGSFNYAGAGCASAWLLRRRDLSVLRLEQTGTVLGLSVRVTYRQRTVDLEPGDLLIAVTDEVTDAVSEAAILRIVTRHPQSRPVDLVREILDAAPAVEDRTALAVRYTAPEQRQVFKGRAAVPAFAAA